MLLRKRLLLFQKRVNHLTKLWQLYLCRDFFRQASQNRRRTDLASQDRHAMMSAASAPAPMLASAAAARGPSSRGRGLAWKNLWRDPSSAGQSLVRSISDTLPSSSACSLDARGANTPQQPSETPKAEHRAVHKWLESLGPALRGSDANARAFGENPAAAPYRTISPLVDDAQPLQRRSRSRSEPGAFDIEVSHSSEP